MKITAAQHVSAVLTSGQSPSGDSGYQTLYYTRELLAPDEVSVIERLVQYSSARESRPKWQSYRLSARRHVLSRVVPVAERDEAGRGGRYFTHSLVCDVTGGQQFDVALLDLLRQQNFLSSLGDVLAAEGARSGHAPAVTFDVAGESGPGRLREWTGEHLNCLYMLMSAPRQLTEGGQHVALSGSEEQILDALKVAFLLAPPAARQFCSFDTNPTGDASPPGGAFWGRGAAATAESSYVIDAARRQVALPDSSTLRANGFSPERVSGPLCEAIRARLGRPSDALLRRLIDGQYAAFIAEPLYRTLLSETALALTPADSELLSPFAPSHRGLCLLLALSSGDDAVRLRTLASLDASSYKEHVRQLSARPGFEPWQAFSPIFMPTWFQLFRGVYRLGDLTAAVTKVTEHGSEQDLVHVEALDEHLEGDERREFGLWLKASPLRLDRLRAALDKPARPRAGGRTGGGPRSFLRRLLHLPGR
jgi:hypothetical protein